MLRGKFRRYELGFCTQLTNINTHLQTIKYAISNAYKLTDEVTTLKQLAFLKPPKSSSKQLNSTLASRFSP